MCPIFLKKPKLNLQNNFKKMISTFESMMKKKMLNKQ